MSIDVNIHKPIRMIARTAQSTSWVDIETEYGSATVFVPFEVARRTADAFNAAMEAERKPVAAE